MKPSSTVFFPSSASASEVFLKNKKITLQSILFPVFKWVLIAHGVFILLIFLLCLLYQFVNPPGSTLMAYRKIFFKHQVKSVQFVPLKKIPWALRTMTVELEDSNFYRHHGIDPAAIQDAMRRNRLMGKNYFGASTIDQQLSRTLFLVPKKNFFRKYLEGIIALEMDFVMKKDRILELYLNSIEWGRGIFGIGRAARYYYNKDVGSLDREEMIRLITILSSPVKYGPDDIGRMRILQQRYDFLEGLTFGVSNTILSNTNELELTNAEVELSNTVSVETNPESISNETPEAQNLEEGAPGTE